jgi:hypothetical protein
VLPPPRGTLVPSDLQGRVVTLDEMASLAGLQQGTRETSASHPLDMFISVWPHICLIRAQGILGFWCLLADPHSDECTSQQQKSGSVTQCPILIHSTHAKYL